MEFKWYFIAFAVIAVAALTNEAVGDYHTVQCRQALASTTTRTVDEIKKMCEAK